MPSRDPSDPFPDDRFLSRWSRLKQEQREEAPQEERLTGEPREVIAERPPGEAGDATEPVTVDRKQLPDIDSLTEHSDFTLFLREGVPEALRQRALRKLWRLNPVFANLDGLNDYDQDFTDAATVVKGLKTLYQVGKGIGLPPADAAAEEELAERSAEQPPSGLEPDGEQRQREGVETGTPASGPPADLSPMAISEESIGPADPEQQPELQERWAIDAPVESESKPVSDSRQRTVEERRARAVHRRWGRFGGV